MTPPFRVDGFVIYLRAAGPLQPIQFVACTDDEPRREYTAQDVAQYVEHEHWYEDTRDV